MPDEPRHRTGAEQQPDHAVLLAGRTHRAGGAEDRTDRGSGPGKVRDGATSEVVREQLFDPIDKRGSDNRGDVPRQGATRVRGQHFAYHAENATDSKHAEKRPERTDRDLGGGREWGNLSAYLPHRCEYYDRWASFIW